MCLKPVVLNLAHPGCSLVAAFVKLHPPPASYNVLSLNLFPGFCYYVWRNYSFLLLRSLSYYYLLLTTFVSIIYVGNCTKVWYARPKGWSSPSFFELVIQSWWGHHDKGKTTAFSAWSFNDPFLLSSGHSSLLSYGVSTWTTSCSMWLNCLHGTRRPYADATSTRSVMTSKCYLWRSLFLRPVTLDSIITSNF